MLQNKQCEDIVFEIREKYAEYLEMMLNPDLFVIGVMAHKIIKLEEYVQYLERRIEA
jgi:hypothetical protein